MSEPRTVEERIRWFLSHSPGGVGWCARHTWRALGGDQGNPPRWYAVDANDVARKLKTAGKLYTRGRDNPPRGAVVLWRYGHHGHMALALGDGRIATTDPHDAPGGVGIETLTYPARFGATDGGRPTGWTDYYAGITFPVGGETVRAFRDYTGKHTVPTTIPGDGQWHNIDGMTLKGSPFSRPHEEHMLYARCKPNYDDAGGIISVRYVRGDGDATAYHEREVTADNASFPVDVLHFELGAKGVGGRWQMRVEGIPSVVITTRYGKLHALDVDWT